MDGGYVSVDTQKTEDGKTAQNFSIGMDKNTGFSRTLGKEKYIDEMMAKINEQEKEEKEKQMKEIE